MKTTSTRDFTKTSKEFQHNVLPEFFNRYQDSTFDLPYADGAVSAITLLKEQHRELEDLFDRIELSSYVDGTALFRTLADKLLLHMEIEENFLYPLATKVRDLSLSVLEDDHAKAKSFIYSVLSLSFSEDHFKRRVRNLKETMTWHIHDEENNLFPAFQRHFGKKLLSAIADQIHDLILLRGMDEKGMQTGFNGSGLNSSYGTVR